MGWSFGISSYPYSLDLVIVIIVFIVAKVVRDCLINE